MTKGRVVDEDVLSSDAFVFQILLKDLVRFHYAPTIREPLSEREHIMWYWLRIGLCETINVLTGRCCG